MQSLIGKVKNSKVAVMMAAILLGTVAAVSAESPVEIKAKLKTAFLVNEDAGFIDGNTKLAGENWKNCFKVNVGVEAGFWRWLYLTGETESMMSSENFVKAGCSFLPLLQEYTVSAELRHTFGQFEIRAGAMHTCRHPIRAWRESTKSGYNTDRTEIYAMTEIKLK